MAEPPGTTLVLCVVFLLGFLAAGSRRLYILIPHPCPILSRRPLMPPTVASYEWRLSYAGSKDRRALTAQKMRCWRLPVSATVCGLAWFGLWFELVWLGLAWFGFDLVMFGFGDKFGFGTVHFLVFFSLCSVRLDSVLVVSVGLGSVRLRKVKLDRVG